MRAIVPGYQSAAATTARRGARSTRQLRVCTTAADDCYDNNNNNNTIQSHDDIYPSKCDSGELVEFFHPVTIFTTVFGKLESSFSCVFRNFFKPANRSPCGRTASAVSGGQGSVGAPGKASQPATRRHGPTARIATVSTDDASIVVSRATRGRKISRCGILTYKRASAHAPRHAETLALYDTTWCVVSAVLIE